jgi:hypothetical protein
MKQVQILIIKLILISLPICSCNDTNKSKEQQLLIKEQELKIREDELLRHEKEIKNSSSETFHESHPIGYTNSKADLSELNEPPKTKKYIYVSIELHNPKLHHSPSTSFFHDGKTITMPEQNLVTWENVNSKSNIVEVINYTDDDKYRQLDLYENEVNFDLKMANQNFKSMVSFNIKDEFERFNLLKNEAKITKKECYIFDSYSEASIHRQNH